MYSIMRHGKPVGYATVEKEGLYYKLKCFCQPEQKRYYRIKVSDSCTEIDLGICVPNEAGFTLTARVPVRQLNKEQLKFVLVDHDSVDASEIFPIINDSPFPCLDKLVSARFQRRNGKATVVIDPVQDQSDNGQNQEPQNKLELP